jgi:hypothetical protein
MWLRRAQVRVKTTKGIDALLYRRACPVSQAPETLTQPNNLARARDAASLVSLQNDYLTLDPFSTIPLG